MTAETRYATSDEVFVAYQVSEQSGPDLLMAPGFVSHLEQMWENPNAARLFHTLGGFSRLIRFDKRGTGLSDRGVGIPHLDERIDDIRAVLDAAKSERAFLFGISEGGPMAMLFAATYPERVAGLILFWHLRARDRCLRSSRRPCRGGARGFARTGEPAGPCRASYRR